MSEDSLPSSPVIVSDDPLFISRARTWGLALGVVPEVFDADASVRRHWKQAPWVLIDESSVRLLSELDLPRRERVFLAAEHAAVAWEEAIKLGVQEVLSGEDSAIVDTLARAIDLKGEACVISVVGACGGIGASTFATAIASEAARHNFTTALVDGDPEGGGLDLVLGAEHAEGMRWPDLARAQGHVSVSDLRAVLPRHQGIDLLTFDRQGEQSIAASSILATLVRGFDVVVADVPRQRSELGDDLLARSVLTVLLVPRQLTGVVRAERLLKRLDRLSGTVAVATRPGNNSITATQLQSRLNRPILTELVNSRGLNLDVEHGLGPRRGPVRRTATTVLETVGLA